MRIRTIKPEFWTHPVMARLPHDVQLLAIALLCYADDEGFFRAEPALVRATCTPFSESSLSTHGAINTLSKVGWIEVRVIENEGAIGRVVNFQRHQRINRPTPSKLKGYFLSESSVSHHTQLSESSLLERKGKEHVQTPPPAREESPVGTVPTDEEVLKFGATWPGEPASAIPAVMESAWVSKWLAWSKSDRKTFPLDWKADMLRRYRSDWIDGKISTSPKAKNHATNRPNHRPVVDRNAGTANAGRSGEYNLRAIAAAKAQGKNEAL